VPPRGYSYTQSCEGGLNSLPMRTKPVGGKGWHTIKGWDVQVGKGGGGGTNASYLERVGNGGVNVHKKKVWHRGWKKGLGRKGGGT